MDPKGFDDVNGCSQVHFFKVQAEKFKLVIFKWDHWFLYL